MAAAFAFASITGAALLQHVLRVAARRHATTAAAAVATSALAAGPSTRIEQTESSVIVRLGKLIREQSSPVLSLAQGVVHWEPPTEAIRAAHDALADTLAGVDRTSHAYGPVNGMPELCAALREKLARENGIVDSEVMVTAGANQAFVNAVVSLVDARDQVVLFRPYYFNHLMALQMTGGADRVLIGETDPQSLTPDMGWLRRQFAKQNSGGGCGGRGGGGVGGGGGGGDDGGGSGGPPRIKLVVMVNPGNPSGAMIPREVLTEAAELCAANGAFVLFDNTYEYFAGGPQQHSCLEGANVVNVFSFSKAYGLMGWRVGYLTYPAALQTSMLKVLVARW
jgi:aspartate/methionine/tyrosine aminotransferase